MDLYIVQYKLNKIDIILSEIENVCSNKNFKDNWWPRFIQNCIIL